MIKNIYNRAKNDFRYLICLVITAISLLSGIMFPNSVPRLAEALRDVVTSVLFYICELFNARINPIYPSVINLQHWNIFDEIWEPIHALPSSWEEFMMFIERYFQSIFSLDNFLAYLTYLLNFLYYFSRFLIVLVPLIPIAKLEIDKYLNVVNTERGAKSEELIKLESFIDRRVYPAIRWCKDFISFTIEEGFLKKWILIWLLWFNVYSILLSVVAFYLYFVMTWDMFNIYVQLLKLQIDITPIIRFIPGIVWLTVGAVIIDRISRSMAYQRLYYAEQCNEAVLRERGVSTVVFGEMGKGKTELIKSMALTAEVKIFKDMLGVMLKYDHFFPNFPWQLLRDELKARIERRDVVDLASCRTAVSRMGIRFDYVTSRYTYTEYMELLSRHRNFKDTTVFGYNYDKYRTTYNDELKITKLYTAVEEYACAYLVFILKTTLLFSNFSIRTDSILDDVGNFPLRDNDFFSRDPELMDMYSKYAHIVDMDMIRLGKMMIEDNEYGRTLHPGVYVISEIDKERKNMLELKETKINASETNQRNDLFNPGIMMSRHANVVDYIPIIYFLFDLQRPEGWGAGGRELGEVIYISDKDELAPALPFFSPYWLLQGIFENIKGKWNNFYQQYIHNRSDETAFVYVVKNIISAISNHYDKINGLFGIQTFTLEIQSGRLDGNVKVDKWRLLTKKDRSNRYRTDCLKSVYESYIPNKMHIDDYLMYEGILATPEELAKQHSFFQEDIKKMKGGNA